MKQQKAQELKANRLDTRKLKAIEESKRNPQSKQKAVKEESKRPATAFVKKTQPLVKPKSKKTMPVQKIKIAKYGYYISRSIRNKTKPSSGYNNILQFDK